MQVAHIWPKLANFPKFILIDIKIIKTDKQ